MNHEKALKEQAKKMNVESLRSNQNQASSSVEIRIAKAAITVCFLFVASWTPYAVLALIGGEFFCLYFDVVKIRSFIFVFFFIKLIF